MASQPTKFSMTGVTFAVIEQGTIRIGGTKVYLPGGAPEMSDQFAITTLNQVDGHWQTHSITSKVTSANSARLRSIPIRLPFNDPDLVLESSYSAFDRTMRRMVCKSTSQGCANRRKENTVEQVKCDGPKGCAFANSPGIKCQWFGRLRVHIDDGSSDFDPTSVFILRSASYNTLRGVEAALKQYHSLFNGRLRGARFKLDMATMTSLTSAYEPFEVVNMSLNGCSPLQANEACDTLAAREAKLNTSGFEDAVRAGLANSEFNNNQIEGDLAAEFFPVLDHVEASGADVIEPEASEGESAKRAPADRFVIPEFSLGKS